MLEFIFLWLELKGCRRISRGIQTVSMSYMVFVIGGLGLAIALNGIGLFLQMLVVPALQSS